MVKYTTTIEPEVEIVRGNIMYSEDDAYNKQVEDDTIARLDRGELEAWCLVHVTAEAGGLTGHAYLGGCSLDNSYTAEVAAKEHDMYDEALADLKERLKRAASAYRQVNKRA